MILLFFSILCKIVSAPTSCELNLKFEGVSSGAGGSYYVAVFRESDPFPKGEKAWKHKVQDPKEASVHFELAPGKYAVAVFHDANGNKKLDTNLLGVPTEAYGFSNNVRGVFSAPSFKDAAFELKSDRQLVIRLK